MDQKNLERRPICTAQVWREIHGADADWPSRFAALRTSAYPWLLDSALASDRLGRFSFAGCDPYAVLRVRGRRLELEVLRAARPGLPATGDLTGDRVLDAIRGLLLPPPESQATGIPFCGGAVGYFGYELAAHFEALEFRPSDALEVPDLVLLFVDRLIARDLRENKTWVSGLGCATDEREAKTLALRAAAELRDRFLQPAPKTDGKPESAQLRAADLRTFFDEADYAKRVDEILSEIRDGNVYQVNFTHRLETAYSGDAWSLYGELRRTNPAPFGAFLELPEVAILSSSPERFLRVAADGAVESRPIKGTSPRDSDPALDEGQRRRLQASIKDRAENLMIVDLVRNDLGRVCRTGSVDVPELMGIESYAQVHQMVSTVRGQLRDDCDALDALAASFPPGSMTGAPKLAAIEIAKRLEPVRRGVYSGALGYLDVRGGADLSVVIRTIALQGGRAFVHAGGGVVADSNPRAEYRESMDKARAVLEALKVSV